MEAPSELKFQVWYSHYVFVNRFSNYNPRMKILLFMDSAKTGLLKNVQKHVSRCFKRQEMSKAKSCTFFLTPCKFYILVYFYKWLNVSGDF